MVKSNRRRVLAEVVTAEAWHEMFKPGQPRADLHIDVVFGIGRIGGGDPTGVRFRLSLKRAEVVVVIPDHEPVAIDSASVRRDAPKDITGKVETKAKVSKAAGLSLSGRASASTKAVKAEAIAKVEASLAASKHRTVTAAQTFKGLAVTQNQTPDGDYRWLVEPALGTSHLLGRPWDATKLPRLCLIDQRATGSKSMPPAVRIEVRCVREDLEISDIAFGDAERWALLKRRKAAQTRRIAAEAAIRTLLTEEGLVVGDMSDPYAPLTLAIISADAL